MFLCSTCHRHVREAPCPFCGGASTGPELAGPKAFRIGMKRSAVLAGAVAAALGSVDCGGNTTAASGADSGPAHEAGVSDAHRGTGRADVVAPATDYGIPTFYDAARAAPPPDAGEPDAAVSDAGKTGRADVIGVGTDYGIPAFDAGHEGRPDVIAGGTDYGIPPRDGDP